MNEVAPTYTLESIENHALNIRDNVWDINSSLRSVLIHLRGEELSGEGSTSDKKIQSGKLSAISDAQQGTRSAQEETFRLIVELRDLLNVNA